MTTTMTTTPEADLHQQFHRQDLHPFQRVELAIQLEALRPDLSRLEISRLAGLGESTFQRGKVVAVAAPEPLKAALRRGALPIRRVYNQVKKRDMSTRAVETPPTPTAVEAPQASAPAARKRASAPIKRRGPYDYMKELRAEVTTRNLHVQGRALTLKEFAGRWNVHTDIARRYIREAALLGLVTEENGRFTIAASPEREELRVWRDRLRVEITRRRNANNDRRGSTRWDPVQINLAEQRGIINFIEEQLDIAPL